MFKKVAFAFLLIVYSLLLGFYLFPQKYKPINANNSSSFPAGNSQQNTDKNAVNFVIK
ncbi:MAG: hypothetical protein QM479_16015 [Pseudomonadota bacterium]